MIPLRLGIEIACAAGLLAGAFIAGAHGEHTRMQAKLDGVVAGYEKRLAASAEAAASAAAHEVDKARSLAADHERISHEADVAAEAAAAQRADVATARAGVLDRYHRALAASCGEAVAAAASAGAGSAPAGAGVAAVRSDLPDRLAEAAEQLAAVADARGSGWAACYAGYEAARERSRE